MTRGTGDKQIQFEAVQCSGANTNTSTKTKGNTNINININEALVTSTYISRLFSVQVQGAKS